MSRLKTSAYAHKKKHVVRTIQPRNQRQTGIVVRVKFRFKRLAFSEFSETVREWLEDCDYNDES